MTVDIGTNILNDFLLFTVNVVKYHNVFIFFSFFFCQGDDSTNTTIVKIIVLSETNSI